jgi:hypothetical protein
MGIASSTYACFHHVKRSINNSQANHDNIIISSSNHPQPFDSKQPLHVEQLNNIFVLCHKFWLYLLGIFYFFKLHNFVALQKR